VVASALASLMDIADRSEHIGIELNFHIANNLVAALNECSEYSQLHIEPNIFLDGVKYIYWSL